MREFKHPNLHGFKCPVCQTGKDAPVVLVSIPGTEDGNVMEVEQIHSECYVLWAKMRDIEIVIEN